MVQYVASVHQVELHPPPVEFTKQKIVHLLGHELDEVCARFPALDELKKEGAESRLAGEHALLGGWLLDRDLSWISDGHELVAPHVVDCHAEGESDKEVSQEDREKAKQIILRKFSRCGLLGFPIWAKGSGAGAEHWALLVVRRLYDTTQVRYYDSSSKINPYTWSIAQLLCKLLEVEAPGSRANAKGLAGRRF